MSSAKKASPVSARDVENYLRGNPEFFADRLELLAEMSIPHPSGQAVSLVERQISVLRKQNEQARAKLHELVEIARLNEELTRRMHRLALRLIDATGPGEIFEVLYEHLKRDFQAECATVRLFAPAVDTWDGAEFAGKKAPEARLFNTLIKNRRPVIGKPKPRQREFLFGAQDDAAIASAVLVPLHGVDWGGVMAIASNDPERFRKGMGVDMLTDMGEALSAVLKPWVA